MRRTNHRLLAALTLALALVTLAGCALFQSSEDHLKRAHACFEDALSAFQTFHDYVKPRAVEEDEKAVFDLAGKVEEAIGAGDAAAALNAFRAYAKRVEPACSDALLADQVKALGKDVHKALAAGVRATAPDDEVAKGDEK